MNEICKIGNYYVALLYSTKKFYIYTGIRTPFDRVWRKIFLNVARLHPKHVLTNLVHQTTFPCERVVSLDETCVDITEVALRAGLIHAL